MCLCVTRKSVYAEAQKSKAKTKREVIKALDLQKRESQSSCRRRERVEI